nr:hypothetical protein [Nannocystis sp.]
MLRLLGVGCALVLAGACANGDDANSGFSISGINPTQVSNPTSASASSTGAPTTGDEGTTAAPGTTGEEGTTSPATTLTTTTVDPSTTTTVDPSTTTSDDTTGVMTTMTTMEESTGDPPIPPPKDPQPKAGLYEHCLDNTPCDASTDGCFTLTDANDVVTDGYCTLLCDSAADCGVKPMAPAVQECVNIAPAQNVCALKCAGVKDCPTGMACINIALPNNGSGMYCF